MSVITLINGVPLFTTSKQATDWGARYNIQGFHNHTFEGVIGYMSGSSHQEIVSVYELSLVPTEVQENFNIVQDTNVNDNAIINLETADESVQEQAVQPTTPTVTPTPVITTTTRTTYTSSGGSSGGGGGY